MSTYLRKCIDIAPSAIVTPGAVNDYRTLRQQSWWAALRATTSHLRLWADWPSLQPQAGLPVGVGVGDRSNAADSLAALDGQVKAATEDGLQVILLPYRYPLWANGTAGIVTGSQQDSDFFPEDRVARLQLYQDWVEGRAGRPTYRDLHYRMPPEGHGPDTAWGQYVRFLWDRYVAQAPTYGRAAYFETINEPNLQVFPQHSAIATDVVFERFAIEGTSLVIVPAVAEMMQTMDALAREHDRGATCLAPSTSDTDITTSPRVTTIAHHSDYTTTDQTFAEPLVAESDRPWLRRRRPLGVVVSQLQRRRAGAIARGVSAPGAGGRRLERAAPGRRRRGLLHRRRLSPLRRELVDGPASASPRARTDA